MFPPRPSIMYTVGVNLVNLILTVSQPWAKAGETINNIKAKRKNLLKVIPCAGIMMIFLQDKVQFTLKLWYQVQSNILFLQDAQFSHVSHLYVLFPGQAPKPLSYEKIIYHITFHNSTNCLRAGLHNKGRQ